MAARSKLDEEKARGSRWIRVLVAVWRRRGGVRGFGSRWVGCEWYWDFWRKQVKLHAWLLYDMKKSTCLCYYSFGFCTLFIVLMAKQEKTPSCICMFVIFRGKKNLQTKNKAFKVVAQIYPFSSSSFFRVLSIWEKKRKKKTSPDRGPDGYMQYAQEKCKLFHLAHWVVRLFHFRRDVFF